MTLRKHITLFLSLLAAPLWGQITDNGSILVEWEEAHRGVFEVSGDFGGGTVYFERNLGGEYVEFETGGYEDDSFYEFVTTASELRVRLTGASSPSVYISINGRILTDSEWTVAEDPAILSLSGLSYWVAGTETDSQTLTNLGSSGAAGAVFGSTAGSDSNDPTSLSWYSTSDYDVTVDGVNYKYLSDNLVTNGTFDTDTDWTKAAGTTISAGKANFVASGSSAACYQSAIQQYRSYVVTYDVSNYSSGSVKIIGLGSTTTVPLVSANGSYTAFFYVSAANTNLSIFTSGFTGSIDNVVVREVTANLGDSVWLPGTSGNYLSHPDFAASPTGDITIQVECALDDWTGGGNQTLNAKWGGGGLSWLLYVNGTGSTVLHNGTAAKTSTTTLPTSDGNKVFIRVTLDVDNGASGYDTKFYTSSDGETFSQLGSTITTAGTISLTDSTSLVELGTSSSGTANIATGSFYSAHIWDSDIGSTATSSAGTPVMHMEASSLTQSGGADEESGSNWTINRSASGLKSTLVTRPQVDGATDDYLEVADHADLDVGNGVDFWVAWYGRYHGTPGGSQVLVAKKADLTTGAGYAIYLNTSRQPVGVVGDGTNDDTITGTALGASEATLIVFQRNGSNIELIQVDAGGTVSATPVTDTTGDLSNALTLRMGRLSSTGTNYADSSSFSWCQNGTGYLTAAQAATLKTELDTELAGRTGE